MEMFRLALAATLVALAASKPQNVRHLDAEVEMGFSHLKKHIQGFRKDMKSWFRDAATGESTAETEARKGMEAEVHKLRQAFDLADNEVEEDSDADSLAEDLAQNFAALDSTKRQRRHRRHGRRAASQHKAFDRAHWEELKDALGTHRPRRHVPGKAERMAKSAHKSRQHAHAKARGAHHGHRREYKEISEVPYVVGKDRCGTMIPASSMGLKMSPRAARVFKSASFLQASNDPSYAHPGAGITQELSDGGQHGTIEDAEGTPVEPFVKVYKDGYSLMGCVADAMFQYADKYSSNKLKFKADSQPVSIVLYKEIVEESEAKAMSPENCYDFCRTVPDMVFFGLTQGRECYCTPYWKPSAEGTGACDLPCEGSAGEMCGGDSKSSVYEMHLCQDTAEDIANAASAAAMVLEYFYQNADQLKHYDENALKSGKKIEQVGGLGGDPVAAQMGMDAAQSSGVAAKLLQDGTCVQTYQELLQVYDGAQTLKDADFSVAKELEKADTAVQRMKELTPIAEGCAKKAEDFNSKAYMFWVPFAESLGAEDGGAAFWAAHMEKCTAASQGYKPLIFMIDSASDAKMSTCKGDIIGVPMLMHYAECAEACEQTVYPDKCVGFQHFSFQGMDGEKALCYMFKEFDAINTYTCDFMSYEQKFWAGSLAQTSSKKLRGGLNRTEAGGVDCDAIAESIFFRGRKCYPKEKDACPDLCAEVKGGKISAACMASVASLGATNDIEVKDNARCFGADQNGEDSADGEEETPMNSEFTGSHKFGAATLDAPTVWTS